jgi:glycosyltransferase involved in cell wall biosynthesis
MIKIKILHLSSERAWRGGEQQIAYLIDELSLLGVENYVAVRTGSDLENYCEQKKIPFFSLPFRNAVDVKTAWKLKGICKTHSISLMHAHSAKSHSLAVISGVFGNHTPLVLSRRVDFMPSQNWFTRWKYNHPIVKKIICVSHKIRRTMEGFVRQPEKCVTVYSGIDLHKFDGFDNRTILRSAYGIDKDYILIGNTSAIDLHKDYFTFVDTIKILVQQQLKVKAIIIGTGPLEDAVKKYVVANHLEDSIIFTGFRKDLKDILKELSIFLMTTRVEGLGTSILDSFLAAVAVVSTNAGGIPEMVIHGKTGMLAEVGDAPGLAAHIIQVINDPKLKTALVAGAKEKVQEFSKQRTAEQTLLQYQEVLKH